MLLIITNLANSFLVTKFFPVEIRLTVLSRNTLFGVTVWGYRVDVDLDEGDHVGAHDALPLREAVGV